MPKPTGTIGWGNAGIEPLAGDKASGFSTGQAPPANWFNWFWKKVGEWVDYLNGLTGEALTWTAAHIFSAAATFNGTTRVTTAPILSTDVARQQEITNEAIARNSADVTLTNNVAALDTRIDKLEPLSPKVWAFFTIVGGGGAGNFTITNLDHEGLAAVNPVEWATNATFRLNFLTNFTSNNYAVLVTVAINFATYSLSVSETLQAAGNVILNINRDDVSGQIDLNASSATYRVSVAIFGRQ